MPSIGVVITFAVSLYCTQRCARPRVLARPTSVRNLERFRPAALLQHTLQGPSIDGMSHFRHHAARSHLPVFARDPLL